MKLDKELVTVICGLIYTCLEQGRRKREIGEEANRI